MTADTPTPAEVTATLEEYRDAPRDYRVESDGVRKVLKRTTRGACLVPIEADRDQLGGGA